VAWGVLVPLGIVIARFLKGVAPASGPAAFWFTWHRRIQTLALVVMLVGFALGVAMTPAGRHFATFHQVAGLVLVIVAVAQPLNACLRPSKGAAGSQPSCARRVWELGHKGAGYASLPVAVAVIFTGLSLAGVLYAYTVAYAVWVTLTGSAFLWAVAAKARERRESGAHGGGGAGNKLVAAPTRVVAAADVDPSTSLVIRNPLALVPPAALRASSSSVSPGRSKAGVDDDDDGISDAGGICARAAGGMQSAAGGPEEP
jgi:hypothetical protein